MRFRAHFFLVFLLVAAFTTNAQQPTSPSGNTPTPTTIRTLPNPSHPAPKRTRQEERPRPRHRKKHINYKDSLRIGFKFCYNTDYPYYVESMRIDFQNTGGVDFIRGTTLGPAMRIPIGRYFFLQPEVLFGFNSDWAAAQDKPTFLGRLGYSFRLRTSSYLWVPLYFGVRWAPSRYFAIRGYAGPRFDFLLDDWSVHYQSQYYSIVIGAGMDLLKVISIETGFQIHMTRFAYIEQTGMWYLGVGLMI